MNAGWGVMQGRFTNKGGFFPQQFPWAEWENEFETAKRLGMDCIEWMFNMEDFERNPLWTEAGRKAIRTITRATGVDVRSLCANYYMKAALSGDKSVLYRLMDAGEALGVEQIVLPLFEASEIADGEKLTELLGEIGERLNGRSVRVSIESDLSVDIQITACIGSGSEKIGICYDVGNAAGMGRNCVEDIRQIIRTGGADCLRFI